MSQIHETNSITLFLNDIFPNTDPWKNVKVIIKDSQYEFWIEYDYNSGKKLIEFIEKFNTPELAKTYANKLISIPERLHFKPHANDN